MTGAKNVLGLYFGIFAGIFAVLIYIERFVISGNIVLLAVQCRSSAAVVKRHNAEGAVYVSHTPHSHPHDRKHPRLSLDELQHRDGLCGSRYIRLNKAISALSFCFLSRSILMIMSRGYDCSFWRKMESSGPYFFLFQFPLKLCVFPFYICILLLITWNHRAWLKVKPASLKCYKYFFSRISNYCGFSLWICSISIHATSPATQIP